MFLIFQTPLSPPPHTHTCTHTHTTHTHAHTHAHSSYLLHIYTLNHPGMDAVLSQWEMTTKLSVFDVSLFTACS